MMQVGDIIMHVGGHYEYRGGKIFTGVWVPTLVHLITNG